MKVLCHDRPPVRAFVHNVSPKPRQGKLLYVDGVRCRRNCMWWAGECKATDLETF